METPEKRAKVIAQRTLDTGAIKVNTAEPFLWASGTRNPFYNNNRKLLDKPEDRKLVAEGLIQLADEKGLTYDAVLGTSLAGIGPAATVAELTKKPLLINIDGKFYQFKKATLDNSSDAELFEKSVGQVDVIAATVPFGIPYGVWLANKYGKRFMYVRPKAKDHGLQKQVEGNPAKGDNAYLINFFQGHDVDYGPIARVGLENEGANCVTAYNADVADSDDCWFMKEVNVTSLRILVIEDLVSTGGSSFKEVKALRDAGATAKALLSIFSYGLPEEKIFEENNCIFASLLNFKQFLPLAVEAGAVSKDEERILNEWYPNQKEWGNQNNFPAVAKG